MAQSSANLAYLRYPDVHGGQVVFTAADDVWIGPLSGGNAFRLTNDGAPVSYPRFSPSGTSVAFTSRASGAPEAWVVPADGSRDPQRLTSWGRANTKVVGWLDDERVIIMSSYGADLARDAVLWSVSLDGRGEVLPLGRSGEVAFHPSGTTVVATPWRRSPSSWKHYQGGTAAKLWISREKVALDAPREQHESREWESLLDGVLAPKTSISVVDDSLVFASDTPGEGAGINDRASGNLWAVNLDGSNLRRLTTLTSEEGYVREPRTDGTTIVYSSRGKLFALDAAVVEAGQASAAPGDDADQAPGQTPGHPSNRALAQAPAPNAGAEPREIAMLTPGVGAERRPFLADPSENLLAMQPLEDSRASVVEWRGSAHVLTHRGGPGRLLAAAPGVRFRSVAPLGSTGWAFMVTDEKAAEGDATGHFGSDAVRFVDLEGEREAVLADVQHGRILAAKASPDGSRLAFITHDNAVYVARVAGATEGAPALESVSQVGRSLGGEPRDLAFSPDSRYLAYTEPNSWHLSRLMIVDTHEDGPEAKPLTSGTYRDSAPAFSADGKHLALLSMRTLDTRYDDLVFDLSFVNAERPHLIPLEKTTQDPFGPLPGGWGAGDTKVEKAAKDAAKEETEKDEPADTAARTVIDEDSLEARMVPFPVESGSFSQLTAVKDGFVWLRHPAATELGSTRAGVKGEAPSPALEYWSLKDRKLTVLAEGVRDVRAAADGDSLVIRQGSDWVSIPATRRADDDDPARITIDTSRLRLLVDPVAERRGMLWDNYRIMAQQYWREDMDGQDWYAMTSWYDSTIERLVTTEDFEDMMWEVVGELGTSHAYVFTPEEQRGKALPSAHLGADLRREGADASRWIIERILPGDSSDPDAVSPLLAPGVAAEVGDAIVEVNGVEVSSSAGVPELLVGTAGKATELVLERGNGGERRRVVVTPLADETGLRYQAWVASRREYVREKSGGRLGYLHIPDMVSNGWAQMHRDLREAVTKDALIVDVRYNAGGHTSQLVTDRLARRVLSWDFPRHERPGTYPSLAVRGPVVLVANEEAGSDGDIVNAVAKAMKIGPVIGTRTWGGVIGIDGRYDLVDGTGITQPKYASWYEGVEWSIENYGVEPDIEVPFPPSARVAGVDPQLDRAIAEVQELLKARSTSVAPEFPPARFE